MCSTFFLRSQKVQLLVLFIALLTSGSHAQQSTAPLRQVRFLENNGQLNDMQGNPVPFVFFKTSVPGLDLYVTNKGLTYTFFEIEEDEDEKKEHGGLSDFQVQEVHEYSWEVVNLDLKNADIRQENIIKEELQQGSHNYYTNRFPNGVLDVHEYGKLTIKNVYPNIDWVLYNTGKNGFKYDFILHPGADFNAIKLSYTGRSEAMLRPDGTVEVKSRFGSIKEQKPVSYLLENKSPVKSAFRFISKSQNEGLVTVEFGVSLDNASTGKTVVIDPQLNWSTFFGGSSFEGTMATEIDANGNLFVCGYTASTDFPHHNAGTYFDGTYTVSSVSFISKFSFAGALLWSTNYEGTSHRDMAVDPSGSIFVIGGATSTMPVQNNSTYFQSTSAGGNDAYILKFDNLGNRIWATYFGGNSSDYATTVCTDKFGNVFLLGYTSSSTFPLLNANTYYVSTMPTNAGFISKFNNGGTLLWSTYYAGLTPHNAATDITGNLLITGMTYTNFTTNNPGSGAYFQGTSAGLQDGGIVKFTNAGALTWATFFGGSDTDYGTSIIGNKNGKVYVLGTTSSTNLPVQNAGGYYDASLGGTLDTYLSRFSSGGVLEWSTYFGAGGYDGMSTFDNLATDSCNNVYIAFETDSAGLPATQSCDGGYYDAQYDTVGYRDIFIARFDNSTQLTWATYAGGNSMDFRSSMATDKLNNLFVTGEWVVYDTVPPPNYPIVSQGNTSFTDSLFNGSDDVYIQKFGTAGVFQAFSYVSPICSSSSTVAPVSASLIPGGNFVSAPGLSINPSTGVIHPLSSTPGTYTISYKAGQSLCSCPQGTIEVTATSTLQILSGPTLSVAGSNTPCIGQVATRTVSGAYTYTWSNGFQATIFSAKIYSQTVLTVTGTTQNGCSSVYTFTIFSRGCDGLAEETLAGVKVYPNPNSGSFTIESQQPADLILSNMLGQEIRTIKIGKEEQHIEINELPKGVYILKDVLSKSGGGLRIVVE